MSNSILGRKMGRDYKYSRNLNNKNILQSNYGYSIYYIPGTILCALQKWATLFR